MLSRDEVLTAFDDLNTWSRGAERAPHKPLLVLYALGRLSRGEPTSVSFREVEPALTALLKEFGPSRGSYHPEYPFWRLQNDGVWIVDGADRLEKRQGNSDVSKSDLLHHDVRAHFPDEIADCFRSDPTLISDVAFRLLSAHFPASLHEDILDAVGLELNPVETVTRRKRDPAFRIRVLIAYEYSCAICGFDIRLCSQPMGLEAAHIRWHQAQGPDEESNGLSLCSIHHKAFDLGAFTIRSDRVLLVSEQANGRTGFDEWLMRYHGVAIRAPQRDTYAPAAEHLDWHLREVFKTPARALVQP